MVVMLDLFIKEKRVLAFVSVAGLIISAIFAIGLWGPGQHISFAGMLIVDQFSIFFKCLILGITALVVLSSMEYVKKFNRFQGEYYALVLI